VTGEHAVRHYAFLGLRLAVSGTDAALDAVHSRLRYFPAADGRAPDLSFEFIDVERGMPHEVVRPSGDARPVGPPRTDGFCVEYFKADDCLYISYRDAVRALCDATAARVRISVAGPEARNLWMATRPVFVLSLFELLKRRGYFNVHAAAVAIGDRVVLLAGHSGAGKSTLAAALCRAGCAFMSDDYVFLARRPEGLRVLAFPEELEMREDAAALMPELAGVFQSHAPSGWWKRQVRVEDQWPTRLSWEGTAAIVVFPAVAEAAASTIDAMSASEAMSQLVSNIQYTRPELAQEHMDLFGTLVRTCACYRLRTGRDLSAAAAMLRALVEPGPAAHGLSPHSDTVPLADLP
jgi:hypothetical protein